MYMAWYFTATIMVEEMNNDPRFYVAMVMLIINIIVSNLFYYWIKDKLGNEKAFLLAFTTAQNLPALTYASIRYSLNQSSVLLYTILATYLSSIVIIFTQYRRIIWHGVPCTIDSILLATWG